MSDDNSQITLPSGEKVSRADVEACAAMIVGKDYQFVPLSEIEGGRYQSAVRDRSTLRASAKGWTGKRFIGRVVLAWRTLRTLRTFSLAESVSKKLRK